MNLNEKSLLSTLNPVYLLIGFLLVILISFYSARRYRNTNDFGKAIRNAMIFYVLLGIALLFLKVPIVLIIGYGICTGIFTTWFSNYYFYH